MSILTKVEFPEYLKSEKDIVEYFMDSGHEYFECGQGIYQDEVDLTIKIDCDYYSVNIKALVLGEKQDRGDRLYFVEEITSVTYSKISIQDFVEWSNTDTLDKIEQCEKKLKHLKTQLI